MNFAGFVTGLSQRLVEICRLGIQQSRILQKQGVCIVRHTYCERVESPFRYETCERGAAIQRLEKVGDEHIEKRARSGMSSAEPTLCGDAGVSFQNVYSHSDVTKIFVDIAEKISARKKEHTIQTGEMIR